MDRKTYIDYMNEISPSELYEGLLAYGLFNEKLPPIFSSVPFFEYCNARGGRFNNKWHDYIGYSATRNTGVPRIMGIPTPMKYHNLCVTLRDNWDEIKRFLSVQTEDQYYKISRIHIRKRIGTKSIFQMSYKRWQEDGNPDVELLIHNNRAKEYLVKADISSCFPSMYSHAIPWAVVGKKIAKEQRDDDTLWFNQIDKACQEMKNGETHGFLVGPHTSNVLSEIILARIDKSLYEKQYRFIRNIDDYDCYVETQDEAQRFLRDLEELLKDFDLRLNHKKVQVLRLPIGIDGDWKHKLNSICLVGATGKMEFPQVNSYIDMAIQLAEDTENDAILNYAMKTLSGTECTDNAKKQAGKRLLHMAALYPYLLPFVEEYIIKPYDIDINQVQEFAIATYKKGQKTNNYESISYSLYYAIKYNFELDGFDVNYVIEHKDCISLLLTWLYLFKLNHGNRKATELKPLIKEAKKLRDIDMDRYWLFCYESLTVGLLEDEWKTMKKAKVSFINSNLLEL